MFMIAIICLIVAIIGIGIWIFANEEDITFIGKIVFIGALALGILFIIGASIHTVPVRNVGIVTAYNKPTGETTGSGLKWTMPWQDINDWDAGRQKYDRLGTTCVNVRISTLANACVEVLIEWQVKPEAAPTQFQEYKTSFENMVSTKVNPSLATAINDAFGQYNPLENIDQKTGNLNVPLAPYAESIKSLAANRVGNDISILTVLVTRVNHDDKTEENIISFQKKLAETRILEQDKKNAELKKQITETNAKVDKITRCLEIAEKTGGEPGLCINPGIVMGGNKS